MRKAAFALTSMLLLLGPAAFAEDGQVVPSSPFKSDENVTFLPKDLGMIGFFQPKSFQGVFNRPEHVAEDLHVVELHAAPRIDAIVVDEKVCRDAAATVLGPLDPKDWKVGPITFDTNRYGKICEFSVVDTDKDAHIKDRRFVVAFIHGKARTFLAKFFAPAKPEEVTELREFVKSLHVDARGSEREGEKTRKPASLPPATPAK